MSKLRISDAPLLPDVNGSEKIPTGGRGDLAISMEQVKTFAQGGLPQQIEDHINDTENPHQVSKSQVGLGNVDNTSDVNKPISTATQEALDLKADKTAVHSKSVTLPTYYTKEVGVNPVIGVADGTYFNVRSTDDATMLVEYQNVGGSAVATGKSYPSSALVQDVRIKAPYFFNTVSAMVAANNISDGMIVGTKGYHNIFDDGGAIYIISAIATDSSIPLTNGLHAVFRDTFDIRKFGIQDSETLDQTVNLSRMVAYADNRVYEIDFLNFSIMAPKSWAWVNTRGVIENTTTPINVTPSQVMGLNFNYCHRLKNLRITHDKSTRLNTSHNLINFLPLVNPDSEQWFELENVTLDPWVDNYQPHSENYLGNYDGMRHGLLCHPAKDSTIPQWVEQATNISFRFKNVHFTSPAYSYNLTTSAIHAKNIVLENLTGDFLGAYLNYMAKNISGGGLDAVRRDDLLESGRLLVGSGIHYEAELTNKMASFDSVNLNNIKVIKKSTGLPDSSYVYKGLGTTSIEEVNLSKVTGHSRFETVSLGSVEVSDSRDAASFKLFNCPTVTKLRLKRYTTSSNQGSFGSNVYMLHSTNFGIIELDDCDLDQSLIPSFSGQPTHILKMVVNNTRINANADGILRSDAARIDVLEVNNVKIPIETGRIIWADIGEAYIDGVDITGGTTISPILTHAGTVPAKVVAKNITSLRTNISNATYQFTGAMNLTLLNSFFGERPKFDPLITLKEFNVSPKIGGSKVYDPPSLAAAGSAGSTTTTTVTATGVKLGDFVQASFTQYHADIKIDSQVSADNTVAVKFTNTGNSTVDLPSGTLAVVKVLP